MLSQGERAKKTFLYDCIRGPFNNIVYTGLMTLGILIAIRYHSAPAWVKSLISSADSIGRLITPITLYIGLRVGLPTARLASIYMVLTGIMLIGVALAPSALMYAVSIVFAYILFTQPPQLMLHIYSHNYTDKDRGGLVSTMFVISITIGIICSFLFGKGLDNDIENYHMQFLVMAAAAVVSAYFLKKVPSIPLEKTASGNAWQNISLVWKDKLFGLMILGYVLLGIGTSMVVPIRVEFMADPKYNINASNLNITLINVVIQGVSMILSVRIWGYIFDRFNFITTRLLVNLCFIISFLTFFLSTNLYIMAASVVFNGFALGGGMIIWSLWVTKIAPKEVSTAYMSAHVSTSGLKGLVSPAIAYGLLALTNPLTVGVTAAVLMLVSCAIFFALRNNLRIK